MATTPNDPSRPVSPGDVPSGDTDPQDLAATTRESTGAAIDGDTPPAEGTGVGPTNNAMDREQTGERSLGKILIGLLVVLVALGILLFVLGRIQTIG